MISKFKHEIFITESSYNILAGNDKSARAKIYSDVADYCDYVSNTLSLKIGMSVMLVVRTSESNEQEVFFVYNQCLDTQSQVNPSNIFVEHNPSLNIDTHIFKGMKEDARNKYFKWGKKLKRKGSILTKPRSFTWS